MHCYHLLSIKKGLNVLLIARADTAFVKMRSGIEFKLLIAYNEVKLFNFEAVSMFICFVLIVLATVIVACSILKTIYQMVYQQPKLLDVWIRTASSLAGGFALVFIAYCSADSVSLWLTITGVLLGITLSLVIVKIAAG